MKKIEMDKIDYNVSEYGKNDDIIKNDLSINENLRELRKYVGLKQTELAEFIDENVKQISRIENGTEIRVEVLKKMQPYLGFSYEKLLHGIEPNNIKSKTTYGMNSDVLKWSYKQDKNSELLAVLNLLFSTGIIGDMLVAIKNYIFSGYISSKNNVNNGEKRGVPQFEIADIIKNNAIDLIRHSLELISDKHHIIDNKKELIVEDMIRNELGDAYSRIYKINKKYNKLQKRSVIEDNLSFEKEIYN